MEYEDWEQITFNDFRGLKRPGYSSDRENHKANTYTTISTRNMGDHIEIKSLFHPCRSYVYDRDLYHNQLLVHELYHFHITEYFARLMRRDIHHLSRSNRTIDLKNLERSYYYEESELQRAYDHETDHGILKGKQLEWQRKIDSSLLSLSDYSDVAIDLN